MNSAHLSAALAYAARGWRVVPTWSIRSDGSCACQRGSECQAAGKHPRIKDWTTLASTDESQIQQWWTTWPDSNVSIVTGPESGIFVVDIDVQGGGFSSVEEYEQFSMYGLPTTLTATTGGGGRHLFYLYPPNAQISTRSGWLPGVDIRGDGGQVVAPPSPHKSGSFYTWTTGWDEGPALPPAELVEALSRGSQRERDPLPGASEILSGVPVGRRNETLFRWACRLRRQLMDDRAAVQVLVLQAATNCIPPMPQDEALTILESAFRQEHDDMPTWTGTTVETGQIIRPFTDDGNALRMVDRHGQDLLWTDALGWLSWDGQRWRRDHTLQVQTWARETSRQILEEADLAEDLEQRERINRWALLSQGVGRIDAMLRLTRDELARRADDFDSHAWFLNVRNGTLDLRTFRMKPHTRDDMLTKVAPVSYDERATCPRWDHFVNTVLPNEDERLFVQRAVGYTLTGVTDAKAMFILWGSGNNGKSVFLEAIRNTLLGEYAKVAAKSVVMEGFHEHPTELAGLIGSRLVTLSDEVDKRDRLRTSLLKAITGGDMMTARFMRQDYFDFKPELKLWIATNHKPGLSDFGDAMMTRLKLIPFTVRIPPAERIDRGDLLRWFVEEGPGILNWALQGLSAWHTEGLQDTTAMTEELESWVEEDDLFHQFLTETCNLGENLWTAKADVYRTYELWIVGRGEDRSRVGLRTFSKEMKTRGILETRREGEVGWRLTLKVGSQPWSYALP